MNIPAMDSLRHERVGRISNEDGSVSMIVQAYVETDETDELGANEPIEGFSRPFPLMAAFSKPTVIEPVIENGELKELSDTLVEYISLLYQSAVNGDWADGLDKYAGGEPFDNEIEMEMASALQTFITQDRPQTVWRAVYEEADALVNEDNVQFDVTGIDNRLRDIEGRERYGFNYLPAMDEVDSWSLSYSWQSIEDENGNEQVSESLWLRYKHGDMKKEIPLLASDDEWAGYVMYSSDVDFGIEAESPPDGLVESILDGDSSGVDSSLPEIDLSTLDGTRTKTYLEAY